MEPLKLFRTVAHNPAILERFRTHRRLHPELRPGRAARPRDRDPPHLCAHGCEYEWGVHARRLRPSAGLHRTSSSRHRARQAADDPAWSRRERLLVGSPTSCTTRARSPTSCGRARRRVGAGQLIELVATAGFYHLVSFRRMPRRRARGVRGAVPASDSVAACAGHIAAVVVAVLVVLLAVNTIVTDRDTKPAHADTGRMIDLPGGDLQVREDGSRRRRRRAAALLRLLDPLVGPGSRRSPATTTSIRFDLLGHGGSEKPRDGYGMGAGPAGGRGAGPPRRAQRAVIVAIRWAARRDRPGGAAAALVRGLVISTRLPKGRPDLPFTARLGFVPVLGEAIRRVVPDAMVRKA